MIVKSLIKYRTYLMFSALFMVLSSFVILDLEREFTTVDYKILSTSILEVNGKTNVNSFCCTSDERFKRKSLIYKKEQNSTSVYFLDTEFKIQIEELDCGKRKINKDLFKALRVDEYPEITIHLKEVVNVECVDMTKCNEWLELEAITDITITCETEAINIPIMVKRTDDMTYRITGGTQLNLCDFDIEAPTAMLGLIKVKDTIEFNFDLFVDLSSV